MKDYKPTKNQRLDTLEFSVRDLMERFNKHMGICPDQPISGLVVPFLEMEQVRSLLEPYACSGDSLDVSIKKALQAKRKEGFESHRNIFELVESARNVIKASKKDSLGSTMVLEHSINLLEKALDKYEGKFKL